MVSYVLILSQSYKLLSGYCYPGQPKNASFVNMTIPIHLRRAALEDLPALSAMAGKIFWETFTGKMPETDLQSYITQAFSPDQLHSGWSDPACIFIIALYKGQWAGYAKINTRRRTERPEPAPYIELERLYVLKACHGQGVGAALMDACVQHAVDHGFQTLWLNVWERNTQAIEFYRRRGFDHVDWSIFMRGDDAQKGLWMKKPL
jgi:GNAT superfamily N-acetyltransferase